MSTGGELDAVELLERLASIDSRNPDLAPDSDGERAVAETTADVLSELGMEVSLHDVVDGRPNVIGVLPGDETAGTFVLEAHLDTVPATPEGRVVERRGSRLHGRGTADTKGSLAGMIAAADRIRRRRGPRPTVVVCGAVDEEFVMRGARALLDQLPPVDGVVIGEPTSLRSIRAHNGFIRVRVVAEGVSAHSSLALLGVNAITAAARCVVTLEDKLGAHLHDRHHPLTGPALLTATMVEGGIAPNIVPDQCAVWFDRRLAPAERPEDALAEIDAVLDQLRSDGHRLVRDEPLIALPGLETDASDALVTAAETVCGPSAGVTYSTDACYLNGYGDLSCIVLGPGSIDQAHTVDEWIEIDQVYRSVDVYEQVVLAAARTKGTDIPT